MVGFSWDSMCTQVLAAQIAVYSDRAHEMSNWHGYLHVSSAASKTKRAREESFGGGGGGETKKAKHCVCNSLFKNLSQWGQTCSCVTHSWWTSLGDKTKHCNSLFSGESNHDLFLQPLVQMEAELVSICVSGCASVLGQRYFKVHFVAFSSPRYQYASYLTTWLPAVCNEFHVP